MNQNTPFKNLIQLQDEAVAAILAATPYATPRKYAFLNRKGRVIGAIGRQYRKGLSKLEIPTEQHSQLWRDVCDVAILEENARD